ncbi:class A beta-lactamase [Salinisphaera japonica]|uniref:Beta-lactamase n=1 Tax=Salinisphaera japonica YTM-1 TaxID=1209778 RepID=A0A423PT43_9GAMM|nr:class A beta-lactamase [Salinisphaera japonica]ROO28754.1 beta-lactamase [Salinisphaera japonica YTM-1]
MPTRRSVIQGIAAMAGLVMFAPALANDRRAVFLARMKTLEARHGGRLGVSVCDTTGARRLSHRGDDRFLLCSTVKLPLAALILSRMDAGQESLERHIDYTRADLVTYSPETEQHVATGMTLGAICRAGLTQSDNTAANLMFAAVGGPAALTDFIRALGDATTRSNRLETALNEPTLNAKDTTTPNAMRGLMTRILLGDVLSHGARAQLLTWMQANQTGDHRLRAGLPSAWRIGDKTGSGGDNTAADIAIIHPGAGHAIVVSAYYAGSRASGEARDRVLADVGRAVAELYQTGSDRHG